jgi:hypothetical protein
MAIVSIETPTVLEHRASVLPLAQLLLDVVEVAVLARVLFPVSGFFTVTENVMVALAPTARSPVQVRFGLAKLTEPAVALASLL